ncbi:MAG: PKD domain-containing protein, partial [Sphingobacteriales bacterium]
TPTTFTITGATSQASDPSPLCWSSAPNNNVWLSFASPTSAVNISTNFTGPAYTLTNTQIAVYSGTCGSLIQIACNDDISSTNQLSELLVTGITPGLTYYIMIDGGGSATGDFGICVEQRSPPNDNCANAIALVAGTNTCVPSTYSNVGAISQPSDPAPSCWSATNTNHGVWFTFQAGSTQAFISTNFFGSATLTNTQIAVYSGACGTLTEVSCNEDIGAGSLQSEVLASGLIPGTTYYIFVDGDSTQQGTFGICVQNVLLTNDNCATAIQVPVTTGSCSSPVYTNTGATSVADPSVTCWGLGSVGVSDPPTNTVWFSFTATTPHVQVSTNFAGPGFTLANTQIAVYSGTCGSMTEVACEEDINFNNNQFLNQLNIYGLTVGNTYYIMVDGYGTPTGTFGLCVQNIPAPPATVVNNDCTSPAFVCGQGTVTVPNGIINGPGSVIGETGACMNFVTNENNSFFYQFTASATGLFCFDIIPTSPTDLDWALFETPVGPNGITCPGFPTGANMPVPQQVACNYNPPPVGSNGNTGLAPGATCVPSGSQEYCPCITITAGQTYTLLIDRWTPGSSNGFTLNLATTGSSPQSFTPPPPNFTFTPACTGNPTNFTNLANIGANSNATLTWNFGDGTTSFAPNPTHTFAAAGSYNVTLTMSVPSGDPLQPPCNSSTTQTVIIADPPQANFTLTSPVCVNEPASLAYSGPALGGATYNWSLDGGTIVSGSGAAIDVTWATAGSKTVSLQIYLGTCTTTVNTSVVEVLPLPNVLITPPNPAICSGQSINLTASGAVSYSWIPSGAFLNSDTGAVVVASPGSPGSVAVIGTGANGCTNTASTPIGVDVFQLVFFETIGSPPVAATTTVSSHEGSNSFDNDLLLMTSIAADIRSISTQQSTGYTGASGGNYVFINFNNIGNPVNQFQIEDINTLGLNNLMLSFGIRKAAVASNGSQLALEYSTDGVSYTALSFPALSTLPGSAGWYLVDSIMGLPATPNLRIRWRNTVNNMQFLIDDITLRNPWSAPTITPGGTVIAPGSSITLTASAAALYSWSGPGVTPAN